MSFFFIAYNVLTGPSQWIRESYANTSLNVLYVKYVIIGSQEKNVHERGQGEF